jgi:small subunit ribosomal protein S18
MASPNRSNNRQKNQNRGDPRQKKCEFCTKEIAYIDYKDYPSMKPFIDYFGNIRARYYSGVCLKHQKMLRLAVERARFLGMLAYRK